ncbi:tape measure protein [uncultured Lactococcus sp.]|uniref:tape measure protein n=1 Tax=uncultured Lactococcus sp. TaxID=167973 RepID=UPI002596734A|nr:tape measure protein [uncultured Lactococcus sp.]
MGKTVSATLKLFDSFSSTLDKVNGTMSKTAAKMTSFREQVEKPIGGGGGMFKSLLGAQLVGGAVSKGLGVAQSAIGGLMGDLDESSKAWQTFQGNMEQLEMPTDKIADAKKDMQDYATQTIYSASDMASTYSQLAAVGIKNTGSLVKGFGGLAAASTDPTQAMKTLSQQATQMAAKPMVQWQDFKLMLEQTPAGIAAVAKTMGKSTSQLVKDVQDGTIKTQEFFDAVSKTGTNKQFSKMATEFKTVGQAVDGLKENLVNGLQKAYDNASKKGIAFVSKLSDMVGKVDFTKIFDKVFGTLEGLFNKVSAFAKTFWKDFTATGAVQEVKDAFQAVGWAIESLYKAFKGNLGDMAGQSKSIGTIIGNGVKAAAEAIEKITRVINSMSPDQVKSLTKNLIALAAGITGFKAASKVIGGVGKALGGLGKALDTFTNHPILSSIALLAGAFVSAYTTIPEFRKQVNDAAKAVADFIKKVDFGKVMTGVGIIAGLALSFMGLAKAMGISFGLFKKFKKNPLESLGKGGKGKSSPLQSIADGFKSLQKSAGIAVVIASIALLAKSMTGIANAGAKAVPNMATFGAVLGGLAIVFSKFGSGLQKNMAGIAVFGAAISVMALAMVPLASASAQAVPNMAAFGLVIGGLAAVFALAGQQLTVSAVGIAVFAGAVSILALAMTPLANAGSNVVANMATFGIVIGGLVAVFSIFGVALTAAIPAMLAFGAAILMAGAGIGAAAPGIAALPPVITALGSAFSQVVGTIGTAVSQIVTTVGTQLVNVFKQAGDSISQVVDSIGTNVSKIASSIGDLANSIGGGVKKILDGVANVISSIGQSALNAGNGFRQLANGIQTLTNLNAGDMANTLLKLAQGLSAIVKSGIGGIGGSLATAGMGMLLMAGAAPSLGASLPSVAAGLAGIAPVAPAAGQGLMLIGSGASTAASGMSTLSASLISVLASLSILTALTTSFTSTASSAFDSFASKVQASMAKVVNAVQTGMAQAVAAVNSQSGALQSAGVNFVQGFINGITSQIGAAASAAASMAKAASSAAKANLDIHSPSRVMRDQVGKYFTLGFAKGITDHTPAAQQASTDMSNAAVSSSGAGDLVSAASTGGTTETGGRSVSIQIGAGAFQIALPDGSQQSMQNLVAALEQYFVELENGSLQYS